MSRYEVANRWHEEDRFWSKVQPTGFCWEWIASRSRAGYGRFNSYGVGVMGAHRWAYETLVGPIGVGLDLDHLCRNRACVNPDHLEPVTRAENTRRGMMPGAKLARSGKCKYGHEFTPENTYVGPATGKRRCRACSRKGG